jgi:predicted RNase H-like nuclease
MQNSKNQEIQYLSHTCREAVYVESYEKAWNIIPKIRDVDSFLIENKIFREKVKEVAPEICFQALTDLPMESSKKNLEGFLERIKPLEKFASSRMILSKLQFQSTSEKKSQKMIFSMLLLLQSLQK